MARRGLSRWETRASCSVVRLNRRAAPPLTPTLRDVGRPATSREPQPPSTLCFSAHDQSRRAITTCMDTAINTTGTC